MRAHSLGSLFTIALLAAALDAGATTIADAGPLPPKVDFNRDIRPIISDNCFSCHGPDQGKRKGKLRLDIEDGGAFTERDGHKDIVRGKSEDSDLYKRLVTKDEDDHMPSLKSNKVLSERQIALIKRWIDQGAVWKGHWSYLKPEKAELPASPAASDGTNPIDRLVRAKLAEVGLKPSAEADRITLIRRLSFDLVGLPPTTDEVDAFVKDAAPDAYERQVDRLLASPHYGERMALYWLDLVRYADSIGFHSDTPREVAPYRDYVIAAFNANKPFDRFTTEQLAGDLLPEPTLEQKIASTYNMLTETTEEGGAQAKEYEVKSLGDRVRNLSTVWMGATLGCAQCHDHKFDPYGTRDFYRMGAFFADLKEPSIGKRDPGMPVPTPKQAEELKRLDEALAEQKGRYEAPLPDMAAKLAAWEKQSVADAATEKTKWALSKPTAINAVNGTTLTAQDDLSLLASGANPATETYVLTFALADPRCTGFRLEALTGKDFPSKGLSRANGNFVLTEVAAERLAVVNGKEERTAVKIASAVADFSQNDFPIANAIDGKNNTGWAVSGHEKPADHRAIFTFDKPVAGGAGVSLVIKLKHESQFPQHVIGHLRLALTGRDQPGADLQALPPELAKALAAEPAKRTPAQTQAIADHYRTQAPELAAVRAEIAKTESARKDLLKQMPTTMISVAAPPRTVRILNRGNWQDEAGEIVTPAVPHFLALSPEDATKRATRLDLARWLVARDNPLTARVFANRLWKLCFGTGLSKILDDLGSQGEWPVNPLLLDWLAVDFMDNGWDVKRLHKLLVMSATYRQASQAGAELSERDPYNRLLARQSRFRIEAELVRDNALAIAGLLSPTIGGPSVKSYQPTGYWDPLNFPKRTWENDHGDSLYRRGLYTHWQRTFLQPSLLAFDAPSREEACAERVRSNTPQQALVALNDPTYAEAARVFAARVMKGGGADVDARISWAFHQALSRQPAAEEAAVLKQLHAKHLAAYTADRKAAEALVRIGESPVAVDLDAAELAAWTSVARTILNLHETITRN